MSTVSNIITPQAEKFLIERSKSTIWSCVNYHGVRVRDKVLKDGDESVLQCSLLIQVPQLSNTNGGGLANIGIVVLQALSQRFADMIQNLVHTNAAHGADSQGANQRVDVVRILNRCQQKAEVSFEIDISRIQ